MVDTLVNMVQQILGSDFIQDCVSSINITLPETAKTLIKGFDDVIVPVAGVLLVVYLLIELMDKMTTDSFNAEAMIKLLIKFSIGIVVISHATDWSLEFMQIGARLANTIGETSSIAGISIAEDAIRKVAEEMGWSVQIGSIVILSFPLLISFALRFAVYFISFGRLIEMGLRAAWAPIGCADIITGGAHSSGIRYLKKMLGISIQGALMIAVVSISGTILMGFFSAKMADGIRFTDLGFYGQYFGIAGAMIGILGSTKNIAFEVVGA